MPNDAKSSKSIRAFDRSLPMVLLLAREAVMERFRPMLRDFGVTEQQWRVLRSLEEVGAMDLGDLADSCRLLRPSLTRIVRDLEERELVHRSADQHDHRRSLISISSAGRALIQRVGPHSERHYREISEAIGAETLEDLYNKLEALADGLNSTRSL